MEKCNLPVELEQSTIVFQEFYRKTHSGRNLAWHTSMGTADLKATLSGQRKEINVNTYQMCVLMLFNDQADITFSEILSVRTTFFQHMSTPFARASQSAV